MSAARTPEYVTLEGEVRHVAARALYFRETNAFHDLCIPLSQVRDADAVSKGDTQIDITKWIYSRLEEEGML